MIVVCPTCKARFQYDDARFAGSPVKRFKCPRCETVFEVQNPATTPAPRFVEMPGSQDAAQSATLRSQIKPEWEQKEPDAARDTTARHHRANMLASAGIFRGMPNGMRYSLAYLTGPLSGSVKLLEAPEISIGREEGDVITRDPETSRRHARLSIHTDGTVWLTDLDSTNGTFVDGIQVFGQVELTDRQEFTCGKSTFMLLIRQEDHLSMD